jgi:hypothetical protein
MPTLCALPVIADEDAERHETDLPFPGGEDRS